jgi:CO/xanthine dehydrogenase FAD-binding subunit
MITTYYRPSSLQEALDLLADPKNTLQPMGGGTTLSRRKSDDFGVVDLQALDLGTIETEGQRITAGAMVRLADLLAHPDVGGEMKRAIRLDAAANVRNMATLGGSVVVMDGRSALLAVLLALDTSLTWEPDEKRIRLGNWLPLRRDSSPGAILTYLEWRLRPVLVFESVARSPKDRPILIVAAAQWGSGRTRIVLGGFGQAPIVAMDGPESGGVDVASRDAYAEADDQWASARYRREVAARLALRCLDRIDAINEKEG